MPAFVQNCHHRCGHYFLAPLAVVTSSSKLLLITFSFLFVDHYMISCSGMILATNLSCLSLKTCIIQVPFSCSTPPGGESPECLTEWISLPSWQDGLQGAWLCWPAAERGHELRPVFTWYEEPVKATVLVPLLVAIFISPFFFPILHPWPAWRFYWLLTPGCSHLSCLHLLLIPLHGCFCSVQHWVTFLTGSVHIALEHQLLIYNQIFLFLDKISVQHSHVSSS